MQASGYEVLLNVDNVRRLLEGLLMTLNVSLVSVALSLPLGVLFGMVMRINNPVTKIASRTYLEFIRIMPQLVLLFVVYFGFTRSERRSREHPASSVRKRACAGFVASADLSVCDHSADAAAPGASGDQSRNAHDQDDKPRGVDRAR